MSSWHLLRKGEKLQRKKEREKDSRVNDWWEKEAHFLAKGVAKMYARGAAEKKQIGEIFQELDAEYFCQRKLFWDTPVYHV